MTKPISERIALVAPSAEAAAVLRMDLIEELSSRGHRVLCLTPRGPGKYTLALRAVGAQQRIIEDPNKSLGFLADWQTITSLVSHFKDWHPNIVIGSGIRTLTQTAIAAERAEVRRIVGLVNGLPMNGIEGVNRRRLAHALRACNQLVFHNKENERYLTTLGLIPPKISTITVPGSGVNLRHFRAMPLPPSENGVSFLMLSRLERSRGVAEYMEAARLLKERWPNATFRLAGPPSRASDAISVDQVKYGSPVEYLGELDDVRPALAACHVFVYPSYAEGMPRAVLEALATGRPVITSRTPGCRETVDEVVNGCLVPPADAPALAAAMEGYLRTPGLLETGSRAARLKAERRFDANSVNAAWIRALGLA